MKMQFDRETHTKGFTLIELSIVLVIIGLIVGGVLVGRDLVAAATVRSQISQIQQYQQAVNTFKGKYGYLPGDIPPSEASTFGFKSRNGDNCSNGNANGIIEGSTAGTPCYEGIQQGEPALFWDDLTVANLIDSYIRRIGLGGGFSFGPTTLTSSPSVR